MRSWLVLALLVLLLVAVRARVLLCLGDVFVWGEELDKACVAKAWLDGLPLPPLALAYEPSEGAALVLAALQLAGFALLGPCLLVVKLSALALELALLALGFCACRAAGGLRAAALFGLLLALAPASTQQIAALAVGLHYQAGLAAIAILWSAVRVVEAPRRARWIVFGSACGLGICFAWTAVLAALAGLALVALRRPRALADRAALAGAASFALGLVPLAVLASRYGYEVVPDHGAAPFSAVPLGDFLRSLVLGRSVPELLGLALGALAPLSVLRVRGPWRLLLALHAAAFACAWATSGFAVGALPYAYPLQRFAPLLLDGLLASAIGLGALLAHRLVLVRCAAGACALALAGLGLAGTLALARAGKAENPAEALSVLHATKGYTYERYLARLSARAGGPLEERLALLSGFREAQPERLHEALGRVLTTRADCEPAPLRALLARVPADLRAGFARGAGAALMLRHGHDLVLAASAADHLEEPLRSWLLEGVGRMAILRHPTGEGLARLVERALAAELPELVLEGLGAQLVRVRALRVPRAWDEPGPTPWRLDPRAVRRFLAEQDPRARAPLERGWRAALARERLPGRDDV